jgi:hypothetical protein
MAKSSADSNVLDTECAVREGYLALLRALSAHCGWCGDAGMFIQESEMIMSTAADVATPQCT